MDKSSLSDVLIITENQEYIETLKIQNKKSISVVPIWKWIKSF